VLGFGESVFGRPVAFQCDQISNFRREIGTGKTDLNLSAGSDRIARSMILVVRGRNSFDVYASTVPLCSGALQ
jgi:hypothetical protein